MCHSHFFAVSSIHFGKASIALLLNQETCLHMLDFQLAIQLLFSDDLVVGPEEEMVLLRFNGWICLSDNTREIWIAIWIWRLS